MKYSKKRKEIPEAVHPEEEGDRSKEEELNISEPIKTNTA
jgi:hypothetical protein